ncbi:tripartite tricarboxylate transporter substrate binding protein [Bosea sp. (in: a-proteobacteria)]|jgi:tripartite-type tricarboxylate transporter receptor subunit TctC|uniref:Bug family tripartite tricarboxylate transporter substrate binding protein n=1 Tax=Bosea sp. (in: a-proteobacteria) TaxID=1871050 RepID=UPI002DDCEBAF|nr:tripartite tricarboxylate transporter substrate binding protein [Bosea sp. (in: a-proteobacteria)]HEV2512108.1 tripartite tricarboxylate transporter substrate binding protein [Bosea sp. (in: a-proteobacteria)]
MTKLNAFAVMLAAAMCVGATTAGRAQGPDFPTRPVTIVVPFPAGSATDAVARKVSEGLQRKLGQGFVIENKAGADGIIASRMVASATPDGYTLLITTNTTHSANPSVYRHLPYDPKKDFAPVGGIIRIPFILAIRPGLPAKDFAGFVKAAKAANPSLSYGSGSMGSRASAELLKARLGFDMEHVPYRGSPQALTDLIGDRIDVFFPDPASALGMIQDKRFPVLAVTGPKRVPTLPDTPTLMELGVPDFNIVAWVAAFAPAATPRPVIERLNSALNELLREPEMIAFVNQIGSEILSTTPAELGAYVDEDAARWVKLVEIAKIEKK